LAIVIIAIVRIIAPPGICERSAKEKPAVVKSTVVEPAIVKSVRPTPVEAAPVKTAKSATVKTAKSAAVKTAATAAMRPGIGEIWQTERGSAQQTSCECKSPSCPEPGATFV